MTFRQELVKKDTKAQLISWEKFITFCMANTNQLKDLCTLKKWNDLAQICNQLVRPIAKAWQRVIRILIFGPI